MIKTLKHKLLLLSLLPMLAILSIAMGVVIYLENQSLEENVAHYKQELISQRQQELKDAVIITKHAIENILAKGSDETAILDDVRQLISPIRFAENDAGYFFIYTMNGVNVAHPLKPEIQGTNQIGATDANGVAYIKVLIDAAKNNGQFVKYSFPKKANQPAQPKESYAISLNGGKWFIGTGLYIDDIDASVAQYTAQIHSNMQDRINSVLLISLILTVISAALILYVASRIIKPIERMVDTLNDIADGEGDLTKRLVVEGNDEIAALGNAFNRFANKLQSIISQVSETTNSLTTAAHNVHKQTNTLTAKLNEHNCETEQVVAAIEQMSLAANEIAENTNDVASGTERMSDVALVAQQQVDTSLVSINTLVDEVTQASSYIDALNQQSHNINNVLKVIGDIAEQTNLLALNAAIEAARAGEQGRGFAVVADEVRGLASRTQSSTLEINEMLDQLHNLVTQAVQAMDKSQASCNEAVSSTNQISHNLLSVTEAVTEINGKINQIAAASTEQNAVTGEISGNMGSIQNIVTDLIQESKNSEHIVSQLDDAGNQLQQLVGQFKTK
ncbi:methyl-accepting chemotaxis protein [Photobacterium lucens]|uniref:methyl-accepting chemotaxis protein n=1 Tax=Photobacterium lucens TaxID=2562949 RepID=UPI00136F2E45|nr:methyl-accepting chemotaxis protein [Photobacterium lucens]MBP2701846.1 methyl-accepting chemotaxis protein [Vibrio parahaemolyticus]MZG57324.1 methyl-accepting chemotaxis protein [Photobacterium lucens]MZG82139.1 methyl-accepting chemotaxis protein [Photobacterium lucens]